MNLLLNNFQGHSRTDIKASGVTVITGESNAGKSSVIRGFLWLATNKPTGNSFIKHGTKEAYVSCLGITRERNTKHNRYIIAGHLHDAIGKEVPAEVTEALNLGPANIQRQSQVYFLIDMTPTAAGALLDESLHLKDISLIESASTARQRQVVKDCNAVKGDLDAVLGSLEGLAWVGQADALNAKYAVLCANKQEWERKLNQVSLYEAQIQDLDAIMADLSWIPFVNELVGRAAPLHDAALELAAKLANAENWENELDRLQSYDLGWVSGCVTLLAQLDKARAEHAKICSDMQQVKNIEPMVGKAFVDMSWTTKVSMMIDKWKELALGWHEDDRKLGTVTDLLVTIAHHENAQAGSYNELLSLKATLPKTCPTCGQAWRGA